MLVVEQRVATGQKRGIGLDLGEAEQEFDWLDPVDAQAPALDNAFVSEPAERAKGAGSRGLELCQPAIAVKILGEVMDPDKVQPSELRSSSGCPRSTSRCPSRCSHR